ncbi:DNA polymerase elongation subunit family B [lymphocystis disease virus-China]|uniref:DNA-directed DNA polymerase n=2 Tax=Lymphocystis disease virus 2 TaxID=159183 RepID=A0A6F8X064_9VIRU|nr:DNA polymerase elongation subunit family B [lymphocystis disease virus-China]AAU11045.1 DNA polymerase elongation subunit family B [lymphocystis disease virus-China]BCB67532.1 DNA polymerase [Lymphocystis disease virus 2]
MLIFVFQWCNDLTQEIRGYGKSKEGKSVCLVIKGFKPYAYVDYSINVKSMIKSDDVFIEYVEKSHLYSVCTDKRFWKLTFKDGFAKKRTIALLTACNVVIHEDKADAVLQMRAIRKLPAVGWIEATIFSTSQYITSCQIEISVKYDRLLPYKCDEIPKIRILALDIETASEDEQFPKDRPGDEIFQISLIFEERKILLSLPGKDYDKINPDIKVLQYNTEKNLLEGLIKVITNLNPDALVGYNILKFDIDYILKRCRRWLVVESFKSISKYYKPAREKTISWSSAAFKCQEYVFVDWEGIIVLDLLPIVERDYKLDNYKLETVANHFLNSGKDPITFKDIFKAHNTGYMAEVGNYCIKDADLCLKLTDILNLWIGLTELAKICNVDIMSLYARGQQIRVYSQLYAYCSQNNIVVGRLKAGDEQYVGAYVVDPVPGLYENVVPLDFSSLYPSIIIAKNICYSTFSLRPTEYTEAFEWEDHVNCIHDPKIAKIEEYTKSIDELTALIKTKKSIKNQEDQLLIFRCEDRVKSLRTKRADLKKSKGKIICAKRNYHFIKSIHKKGVVPAIVADLLEYRKRVKVQIAETTDSTLKIVLDKRQLACKISANSIYGSMGVSKGYLPFMPGAMCITRVGRLSIEKAAAVIESKYGGALVYGDTDSNYVQFKDVPDLTALWNKAEEVADNVSKEFPMPMKLEFENVVYVKFLILSKKRYMYVSCNKSGCVDSKLSSKGVLLARRDNAGCLKNIYNNSVLAIMHKKNIFETILNIVSDVIRGVLPIEDFVITKSINDWQDKEEDDEYLGAYKIRDVKSLKIDDPVEKRALKIAQCPGQVKVAEKMRLRGIPVENGTRIEYVILKGKGLLGDKMEYFDYYKKRSRYLKLDHLYYLKNMINPLDQLLEVSLNVKNFMKSVYDDRKKYDAVLNQINTLKIRLNGNSQR